MSEPVLQVKGLKTYYYTEEGVVPAVDGLVYRRGRRPRSGRTGFRG